MPFKKLIIAQKFWNFNRIYTPKLTRTLFSPLPCSWSFLFSKISRYDFDTYAASPINNGSIIEVGYDKKKGTISFVIDGVNQGIAYNIPEDELDEPLYPAVNIGHPEAKLELL